MTCQVYHPTPSLRPPREYGFYVSIEFQQQGGSRSSATRHPETRAAGVVTLDIALAPTTRSHIDTTTSSHIAVADSDQEKHIEKRWLSKPLRRAKNKHTVTGQLVMRLMAPTFVHGVLRFMNIVTGGRAERGAMPEPARPLRQHRPGHRSVFGQLSSISFILGRAILCVSLAGTTGKVQDCCGRRRMAHTKHRSGYFCSTSSALPQGLNKRAPSDSLLTDLLLQYCDNSLYVSIKEKHVVHRLPWDCYLRHEGCTPPP